MFSHLPRRVFQKQFYLLSLECRTFLSDAYKCQEVWEGRKKADIFKSVDYDDLYHQLDRSFQIGQRISLLDVDLFVNGLDNATYKSELEDVLFKLRLNPETNLLSERTMHAVIKFYTATRQTKELVDILSDRLNYGIFPDYYASNILMDLFLKQGDSTSAAKIAVLQMLQEDFEHPIMLPLSIFSCLKYLNSSEVWLPPKDPEVDPDEEETKVRVSFIRNSYFDDHFDLVDPNHLVGKTLYLSGQSLKGPLGVSCQLVGLALFEKWAKVLDLLKDITLNKTAVHKEAIEKTIDYIKNPPKQEEGKVREDSEEVKGMKTNITLAAENLIKSSFAVEENLLEAAETEVKRAVAKNEANDIQNLTELYKNWEIERKQHLDYEILESKKRKIGEEIVKTKEELAREEEVVFFFDNEDKWDLKVEEKEKEIAALQEQQKTTKKKSSEEEYIPPEVGQKKY